MNRYQVSKLQTLQVLLGLEEYQYLLQDLGISELVCLGQITEPHETHIATKDHLTEYQHYIQGLQQAEPYTLRARGIDSEKAFIERSVQDGRVCLLPKKPFVQIQEHTFMMTSDGRVQSMCFGKDQIRWGVQISYPALFYNPETEQPQEMLKQTDYGNTSLFLRLRRYLRHASSPVTLELPNGTHLRTPFRIGASCRTWIDNHPDLRHHNIKVKAL